MQRRTSFLAAIVALFSPAVLAAQQGTPPCAGEEHRQFDFWLGDWDVTVVGNGQVAGTNEISVMLGGCVLHESYSTPTGYVGNSFNAYDQTTGSWHQTWVDNAGTVLKLDGGIVDGKMVLSGPGKDAQGNDIINQITWTPHADGAVQQTWLVSSDGGTSWTTSFDGMYRKKPRR
jgi:hypothetical protein